MSAIAASGQHATSESHSPRDMLLTQSQMVAELRQNFDAIVGRCDPGTHGKHASWQGLGAMCLRSQQRRIAGMTICGIHCLIKSPRRGALLRADQTSSRTG